MKLAIAVWSVCAVALALTLAGLALHLSAAGLSGASALSREDLASGLVNIGGKLAILGGLIAAFVGGQQAQWRWVTALGLAVAVTLFCGPLSVLTNTGAALYFIGPVAATLLAIAYTFRMRARIPARIK